MRTHSKNGVAEVAPNVAKMLRWLNQVHGDLVFQVHRERMLKPLEDEKKKIEVVCDLLAKAM